MVWIRGLILMRRRFRIFVEVRDLGERAFFCFFRREERRARCRSFFGVARSFVYVFIFLERRSYFSIVV